MSFRGVLSVPSGDLDIARCIASGQVFRWDTFSPNQWFGIDGPAWFRVTAHRGDEEDRFEVESNRPIEEFSRLFRLDWDAREVEAEIVRRGPELQPYMARLRGLRLLRSQSPTETFFSFLCTPNNNLRRITGLVRHLALYGPAIDEVDGRVVHQFPNVEQVADIPPERLRAHGFGYRAGTIPTAARFVLEKGGDAFIEQLRYLPYEEAHDKLLTVPYVGRKLADCIALFGLDHHDVVPLDTHMWQVMTRLYFPEWQGNSLTDSKYRIARDFFRHRFNGLAGWAQQALFYDNMTAGRKRLPDSE